MPTPIQLIVGLGNPGAKYQQTRHNAGVWFIDNICRLENCALRPEAKFQGLHGVVSLAGQDCHLFVPSTFMNLSGIAVRAVASFYKIPTEALLVAHDEIDLDPGTVRLKFDGGHGGHNGLRDIIEHLGTKQFHRLRIGVGHPGRSEDVVDYVLNPPSKADRQEIDLAMQDAEGVLPLVMKGEFQKAMHKLHSVDEK